MILSELHIWSLLSQQREPQCTQQWHCLCVCLPGSSTSMKYYFLLSSFLKSYVTTSQTLSGCACHSANNETLMEILNSPFTLLLLSSSGCSFLNISKSIREHAMCARTSLHYVGIGCILAYSKANESNLELR